MESIIVALIGAVVTVWNVAYTTHASKKTAQAAQAAVEEAAKNKEDKALADGLQCLLRAEIIRTHAKYTERKYCPIWARENLTEVHDAYKALGGNHIGDELYNEVMALPFDAPDNN